MMKRKKELIEQLKYTIGMMALAVVASVASPLQVQAQDEGPIRLIVPFEPGGSTDLVARLVAEKVSKRLNRPVIVDNRTGAGGHIGSAAVAKAPADGRTLLLNGTGPLAISVAAGIKLNYDPMKDLVPIGMLTRLPNLVAVKASSPFVSIADLVEYGKANPGKLNYGMSAIGNLSHLNAEMFAQMNSMSMVGVPYKGNSPLILDLLAGRIDVSFDNLPPFVPHVKGGRLRALAVTSATRSSLLPDVPSLTELGYQGFDNAAWFGIFAPAGLDKSLVKRMNEAFTMSIVEPDLVERLKQYGIEPAPSSPEDLADRLRKERDQFARVIKAAGIRLE